MTRLLTFLPIFLLAQMLAAQRSSGRDYAVFFYVTQFQPGWQALPETEKESLALKTELATNFGFTCELVPNPSKQQIRDKLREYNARLKPEDQALFFFSMHGHYDEGGRDRGYLIAKDGKLNDDYRDTWLSYDDLRSDLDLCRAQHILLALDACHSGAFGIRNKSKPDHPVYEEAPDCAAKIAKTMRYTGRQFCSSGNKTAKTPAKSQFAARFLEALRKGGSDGLLFFDDLEYWLGKAENPQPESGTFAGHAPGGDFVFVSKTACAQKTTPLETPEQRSFRDLSAWTTADATKNYQKYLDEWCPGGAFCEAAEAKTKVPAVAPAKPDNMVFIKGGTFQMGSNDGQDDEKPVHTVTVSNFYLSKYEVTVAEFRAFVEATGYETDAEKNGGEGSYFWNSTTSKWELKPGINWRHDAEGNARPGSEDSHPVIHISWNDAVAYCEWLSKKTSKTYRLPTEAEWEYAAGNGLRHTKYSWGSGDPTGKKGGNVADKTAKAKFSGWTIFENYADGYVFTAPVGSFDANDFGLHDMTGNVWEWCGDDWHDSYEGAPSVGRAWVDSPRGSYRVLRGGSWFNVPLFCRVAVRSYGAPVYRVIGTGFRLARTN